MSAGHFVATLLCGRCCGDAGICSTYVHKLRQQQQESWYERFSIYIHVRPSLNAQSVLPFMQGSLAQLDSQNPVMYIDFPQGRLKFLGTIVFPKNKYMLLKFGQKDVLCEDIFENMVRRCYRLL